MKYALLDDTNTVIQTEPHPREGLIPAPDHIIPGYLYNTKENLWIDPLPVSPEKITPEQHIATHFSPLQVALIFALQNDSTKVAATAAWLKNCLLKNDTTTPPPHTFTEIFS